MSHYTQPNYNQPQYPDAAFPSNTYNPNDSNQYNPNVSTQFQQQQSLSVAQAAAQSLQPTSPSKVQTYNNNSHDSHAGHNHGNATNNYNNFNNMNSQANHGHSHNPSDPNLYYDDHHGHSHSPDHDDHPHNDNDHGHAHNNVNSSNYSTPNTTSYNSNTTVSRHVFHNDDSHGHSHSDGEDHGHSHGPAKSHAHSDNSHDDHSGHNHAHDDHDDHGHDAHHGHAHSIIPSISMPKMSRAQIRQFLMDTNRDIDSRKLGLYISLKGILMGIQFFLGLFILDMEIISSSFHTGFDCIALFITLLAMIKARSTATNNNYSYGYARFEVLSAFTNSIFLFFVAVFIFIETIHNYYNPPEGDIQEIVLIVIAWVIDVIAIALFMKWMKLNNTINPTSNTNIYNTTNNNTIHPSHRVGKGHYSNMHSIYLHAQCDFMLHSAFLLAAIIMKYYDIKSVFALFYGITTFLIVKTIYPLFEYSGGILLQTTDNSIRGSIDRCLREISFYDGVLECIRAHWWCIEPGVNIGTLHIRVRHDANEQAILNYVNNLLKKYITDLTVQIEKDAPIAWIAN